MPIHDPAMLSQTAEAAFGPNVEECYANNYYVSPTDFDIRIAFGTRKFMSDGSDGGARFNTPVYLNYSLAKNLVAAMQTLIDAHELRHGPADIVTQDPRS